MRSSGELLHSFNCARPSGPWSWLRCLRVLLPQLHLAQTIANCWILDSRCSWRQQRSSKTGCGASLLGRSGRCNVPGRSSSSLAVPARNPDLREAARQEYDAYLAATSGRAAECAECRGRRRQGKCVPRQTGRSDASSNRPRLVGPIPGCELGRSRLVRRLRIGPSLQAVAPESPLDAMIDSHCGSSAWLPARRTPRCDLKRPTAC